MNWLLDLVSKISSLESLEKNAMHFNHLLCDCQIRAGGDISPSFLDFGAVTEMVPDLILAPDFFGPGEIWSPRNLGNEKFGPREIWALHENHYIAFSCRNQLLWGPKFLGTKFLGD